MCLNYCLKLYLAKKKYSSQTIIRTSGFCRQLSSAEDPMWIMQRSQLNRGCSGLGDRYTWKSIFPLSRDGQNESGSAPAGWPSFMSEMMGISHPNIASSSPFREGSSWSSLCSNRNTEKKKESMLKFFWCRIRKRDSRYTWASISLLVKVTKFSITDGLAFL